MLLEYFGQLAAIATLQTSPQGAASMWSPNATLIAALGAFAVALTTAVATVLVARSNARAARELEVLKAQLQAASQDKVTREQQREITAVALARAVRAIQTYRDALRIALLSATESERRVVVTGARQEVLSAYLDCVDKKLPRDVLARVHAAKDVAVYLTFALENAGPRPADHLIKIAEYHRDELGKTLDSLRAATA